MRGKLESNEVAAGAVEQNRLEVQLATNDMITFPSTMKLLGHPNIFIADSAFSAHSTGHIEGIKGLQAVEKGARFMLANGSIAHQAIVGHLFSVSH